MKTGFFSVGILLLCLAQAVYAQTETSRVFEVGSGKIDGQKAKVLHIPGAHELEVVITGEIATQDDILRIYTYNHKTQKTGHLLRGLEGKLGPQTPFTAPGDAVKVTFNSKGKTQRKGVKVAINLLSPSKKLKLVQQGIFEQIDIIGSLGAAKAADTLNTAIQELRNLHQRMQSFDAPNEELKAILAEELRLLANTYTRVATLQKILHRRHQQAFDTLQAQVAKTLAAKNEAQRERDELQNALNKAQAQAKSLNNELEARKNEITRNSLQSRLNTQQVQLEIWQRAHAVQKGLEQPLRAYAQQVQLLLFTLEANGRVYQDAAYILMSNEQAAREALTGIANLQIILEDMNFAWQKIEQVRHEIAQTGF